jgi:WXG100 family type VII secretion target
VYTSAETDAMGEAATHVDGAGKTLSIIRNNIDNALLATEGHWVSPAAALFRSVMAQWSGDFNTIINDLQDIHFKLVKNRTSYDSSMDFESAGVNQISALLNGTAG